jgi:hypothetical protein
MVLYSNNHHEQEAPLNSDLTEQLDKLLVPDLESLRMLHHPLLSMDPVSVVHG